MIRKRSQTLGGFTLVEALIALVIISMIFLGMMRLFQRVVKSPHESFNRTEIALQANTLMARIRLGRWDERGPAGTVPTAVATLGQDAGESVPADFDDIDDWDGYSDTVGPFSRHVSVRFMRWNNASGAVSLVESPVPTDLKQVQVTVTCGDQSKTLSALFSNG